MLNIEHLLMKQRYFALEEISTVFLAIGFAQYTIYHFKYRKYKNSAIAKVIDYEEKYLRQRRLLCLHAHCAIYK